MFSKRTSTIDERRLLGLIEESQDLQVDAMRQAKASLPDLRDIANDRRHDEPVVTQEPRLVVTQSLPDDLPGTGDGAGWGKKAAIGGAFGAMLAGLFAKAAFADKPLDVQILQTASSLERLAVNTYAAALTLDFIKNGNATVIAFAQTTMKQHDEHRQAFQAQTEALGGKAQDEPNPVFQKVVDDALPSLKAPIDVVTLAAALEKVATDTYLNNTTLLDDKTSIVLFGTVMGVECQHLATLRAVGALLEGGAPELIAVPTDLAKLPAAAGSVAFPEAFETIDMTMIATPESGAVK